MCYVNLAGGTGALTEQAAGLFIEAIVRFITQVRLVNSRICTDGACLYPNEPSQLSYVRQLSV